MDIRKTGTRAALALSVAALVAPVAQAGIRPDDRGGVRGAGGSAAQRDPGHVQVLEIRAESLNALRAARTMANASTSVRPDDRAGARGAGTAPNRLYEGYAHALSSPEALGTVYPPARPDDRSGFRGAGDSGVTLDAAYLRALENDGYASPDDRGGVRGVDGRVLQAPAQVTHGAIRPDDRNGVRGADPMAVSVGESSGFDWSDAGIGALGAFGLALLGGGMLVALQQRQQRQDRIAVS